MIVLRFTLPRFCLASSVVCLQMALLPCAFGQAATSALDGAAFAAPSEIISAAAKVTPEKYANVTILYEEEKDVLDAEGRVVAERNGSNARQALSEITARAAGEDAALSVVTLIELAHGAARADTPLRKAMRRVVE